MYGQINPRTTQGQQPVVYERMQSTPIIMPLSGSRSRSSRTDYRRRDFWNAEDQTEGIAPESVFRAGLRRHHLANTA